MKTTHINSGENVTTEGGNESVASSERVNTVHSHTDDSAELDSRVISVRSAGTVWAEAHTYF